MHSPNLTIFNRSFGLVNMARKLPYQLIILLIVTSNMVAITSSADVLFLMPLATKSETHLLNPMAKAMLMRGHRVTLVTSASSSIKHSNFTEIVSTTPLDMSDFNSNPHDSVIDMRKKKDDMAAIFSMDFSFIGKRCHETYQHKDFAQVLEAKSYDLALTSGLNNDCFFGLIHKLNAPYILLLTMPIPFEFDATGFRTPQSFVPNPAMPFSDNMSLSERLINIIGNWMHSTIIQRYMWPMGEDIYRQYLGEQIPSVVDLKRNVNMIFSNSHFSMNYPRPLMPDAVEIGGVHTHEAKPLPKDLEEFCSGGDHGFILFSLGTVFREETFPDSLKKIFINVFSRLKTRVLWKWQSELKGLPENVKVSKWLPQQDVLGILSWRPNNRHSIVVDQDANMINAETHGLAMKLELLDITEEYLENALHKMLNDSSFTERAKQASEIFRDQPQTPLERAVYHMEYLIKYKGAPQLRSSARDLSYIQYYLYDVQLILLSILGVMLFIVWKILSTCLKCMGLRGKANTKINLVKKHQ